MFNKTLIFSILVLLSSFALLFSDGARKDVQNWFRPENKVLSIVTGDMYPLSPIKKVVKSMTDQGIVLMVYTTENGQEYLLGKIELGDPFDAYYELNQRPTNLALNDMNGDGLPEIIAPTYTLGWQPKLNVFRFNEENQQFEQY